MSGMEEGVDDEARRQRRATGRQRLPTLLLVCLALPTGGSPDMPANVTVDLGQRVELPCGAHNQVFLAIILLRSCLRNLLLLFEQAREARRCDSITPETINHSLTDPLTGLATARRYRYRI